MCTKLKALHLFATLQQKFITTLTKCLHLWKNSLFAKTLFFTCWNHYTATSLRHKQPCSINKQENYSKTLYYKTLEQHKNFLLSQWNHWYWLQALCWWRFNISENTYLSLEFLWNLYSMDKNMSQLIKIAFYQIVTEM